MGISAELDALKRDLEELVSTRRGRPSDKEGRGREAEHPGEIPPGGWMDILKRSWGDVSDANLFLVAGGVTYAILLALFPGLAALVAIYGLLLDPSQIEKQVGSMTG